MSENLSPDQIRQRIVTLADELQEMHTLISDGLPADEEGFVKPTNPDLADALKTIEKAITVLSRLAHRM
jgi:hypothetical protein